jgi:hypothetical protein
MKAEERSWNGFAVSSAEATWVCIESRGVQTPGTSADRIDYFMVFAARDPRMDGVPATRKVQLRTSGFRVSEEPGFFDFLKLVVEGQLLETTPWDRFKEVYERD